MPPTFYFIWVVAVVLFFQFLSISCINFVILNELTFYPLYFLVSSELSEFLNWIQSNIFLILIFSSLFCKSSNLIWFWRISFCCLISSSSCHNPFVPLSLRIIQSSLPPRFSLFVLMLIYYWYIHDTMQIALLFLFFFCILCPAFPQAQSGFITLNKHLQWLKRIMYSQWKVEVIWSEVFVLVLKAYGSTDGG